MSAEDKEIFYWHLCIGQIRPVLQFRRAVRTKHIIKLCVHLFLSQYRVRLASPQWQFDAFNFCPQNLKFDHLKDRQDRQETCTSGCRSMWTIDQANVVAEVSPPAKNRSKRMLAWPFQCNSYFLNLLHQICHPLFLKETWSWVCGRSYLHQHLKECENNTIVYFKN